MADISINSWSTPAMDDFPLFIEKAVGDDTNVNGVDGLTSIAYSAQDMRDLLLSIVQGSGTAGVTNFTITAQGTDAINISSGLAFVQSASQVYGTYFVKTSGTVTVNLPPYVSGVELYNVIIQMSDRANNPSAVTPDNYGWSIRVMGPVGGAAAATPAGAYSLGVVRKSGSASVPTIDQTSKSAVVIGRSTPWYAFPTFYSTWTAYGVGFNTVRYRRLNSGLVVLDGMARAGASSSSGEAICALPLGFRPDMTGTNTTIIVNAHARANGVLKAIRVYIRATDGYIIPYTGDTDAAFVASTDYVSLSGISFMAEGF